MVEVSEEVRASPDLMWQVAPRPVAAGGPTAECIEIRWAGGAGGPPVRDPCDAEGPDRSDTVGTPERIRAHTEA